MFVVLAPPTSSLRDALEVLEQWSRSDLLRRLVWWEVSGDDGGGREVTLIDGHERVRVDLAEALEGWAETIELVALIPASSRDDRSAVDEFVRVAEDRREQLRQILDFRDMPLVAVVAPEPGGVPLAESVLDHRWRHIVVIAPEDRRSPTSKDVNRLAGGQADPFVRHLAMQLACLGRLWRDCDQADAPLAVAMHAARQGADALAAAGERTATLARSFTRLVDGGYLIDHVAARAMRPSETWPLPRGLKYREVQDWPEKRDYLARRWAWEHRVLWGEVEDEWEEDPPLGCLAAIQRVLHFVWHSIILLPYHLARFLFCKARDLVATAIEHLPGMAGKHISRCGERRAERPRIEGPAPPPSRDPDGAIGAAWTDLREIAIGLIDGSRLPDWVVWTDPNRPDQVELATDPDLVVPDPEELTPEAMASLLGVTVPRACDPRAVLALAFTLTGLLDLARQRVAALERLDVPPIRVVDNSPPRTSDLHTGVVTGDDPDEGDDPKEGDDPEDDETDAPPPTDETSDAEVPPVLSALDIARRNVDELESAIGRLGEWLEAADRSLFWAVGAQLWQRLDAAEAEEIAAAEAQSSFEAALAAVSDEARTQAELRFRKRRRLTRLLRVLATLAAIGGLVWVARADGVDWVPAGVTIGVAWAVVMVGMRVVTRRARRVIREIDGRRIDVSDPESERQRLAVEVERTSAQADRLRRRYAEFLDWGDILGWLLHHPWAQRGATGIDLPEPLDPELLPAAFDFAVAAMTPENLENLVKLTRVELFDRGWLDSVYDGVVSMISKDLLIERGIEDPYVAPHDPSADASPRQMLLDAVRNHEHETVREVEMTQRVVAFLGARAPAATFEQALRVKDGAELAVPAELPPIAQWRAAPPQLADLTARVRPAVVKLTADGGGGSGVAIDGEGLVVTNAHVVAGSSFLEARLDDQTTTIARVLYVSDRTDLALVRLQRPPTRFVQVAQWDAVRQGEPIFTVGFPLHLEGEPTTSWGIVAARNRIEHIGNFRHLRVFQHDAPTRPGASGSGVFNLACELVGVHVAGAAGTDYIKYAIPVDDVSSMLREYGEAAARRSAGTTPASALVAPPEPVPVGTVRACEEPRGAELLEDFLVEITQAPKGHLQHDFWRPEVASLPGEAEVVTVLATPRSANLESPTPRFGRPWRLQTVRVELVAASPVAHLRWFTEADPPAPGGESAEGPKGPGPELLA